ncbi:MAG: hypothetical protein EOO43_24945, partial [Flavobacterium sp.]
MDTPVFNIHDLILIMTFAVSGVLALFQPIVPYGNRLAKIFLGIFYICIAIDAVSIMLLWNEYIKYGYVVSVLLPYFFVVACLIKGAALYLYVLTVTKEDYSFKRTDMVHFSSVIFAVIFLATLQIDSRDLRFEINDMTPFTEFSIHSVWYFIKVIPIFYAVAAVISLRKYRSQLRERYSTINDAATDGLNYLVIGFLASWIWTLFVNVLGNSTASPIVETFGIADNYITFLLVIALFAYSISYVKRLLKTTEEIKPVELVNLKPNDALIDKIRYGIDIQKLYL